MALQNQGKQGFSLELLITVRICKCRSIQIFKTLDGTALSPSHRRRLMERDNTFHKAYHEIINISQEAPEAAFF